MKRSRKEKISASEDKVSNLEDLSPEVSSEMEAACLAFKEATELTYDMAHAFVDRILVSADGSIEIRWRFMDIFTENK